MAHGTILGKVLGTTLGAVINMDLRTELGIVFKTLLVTVIMMMPDTAVFLPILLPVLRTKYVKVFWTGA